MTSSSSRLLGFNISSGDFDYLTTDSTGALNITISGEASNLCLEATQTQVLSNIVSCDSKLGLIDSSLTTMLEVLGDAVFCRMFGFIGDDTYVPLKADATGNLSVIVANATGTQLDVKSSNTTPVFTRGLTTSTVQVATSANVTGPQQIGTIAVDTDGYLWVGAFISCPSGVSSGGQIYMQYSADNSVWAQSTDSVFVMSSGAATTGLIRLSSPVAFRYVRLWADTGFSATGVNAFIVMK